jgi:hypothetical protein
MSPGFRVLNSAQRQFSRLRMTTQLIASKNFNNAFRARTIDYISSQASKKSASASLIVSVTGLLIWIADLKSLRKGESWVFDHKASTQASAQNQRREALREAHTPRNATYYYSKLAEDEVTRLLILEPGEDGNELKCHLRPIKALQDHEYEALSYAWGKFSTKDIIICGGADKQITPNLEAALRQLRYTDRPRILWVDAICIDQEDVAERSRQVRMMQNIYPSATQVVVWLGPETPQDNRAFGSLRNLETHLEEQDDSWFKIRLGWWRNKSGKIFSGGAHRSMLTDVEYEHLVTLLRRDWFHRTCYPRGSELTNCSRPLRRSVNTLGYFRRRLHAVREPLSSRTSTGGKSRPSLSS